MFPRQPSPTGYHNTYQLYTMENTRQTILNDYITSQQMQVIPRPDMARGLSPREQPVTIPYAPGARGTALCQLNPRQGIDRLWVGERGCSLRTVSLWSSGYLFQTPRSKWPSQNLLICFLHWGCNWFGCYSISSWFMVFQISICRVVSFSKLTTIPLPLQPYCLLINLYLEALT